MQVCQVTDRVSGEERTHSNTSCIMGNHMYDGQYAVDFYTVLSYR